MKREFVVHPEGFEPSTPRAEIWYSIQLNYGCYCLKSGQANTSCTF